MADVLKSFSAIFVISLLLVSGLSPVFDPVLWAVAQDSSVPVLDGSPLAWKKSAVAELGIVNGSGQDKAIFEQAEKGLQNSVDRDFYDDYHVKNPLTVAGDLLIVRLLQSTSAFKNGSSRDHMAVVSCIRYVVLSDRGLANVSIGDASNASLRVKDPFTLKLVNSGISKAKKSQAAAESYLQSQNMLKAIEYYGITWAEASVALLLADGKTMPTITITSPANGTYVSASTVNVSGVVDDVAVYSIGNVTLTVNGRSSVVPVSGGVFSQQVQFREGVNVVQVTVKDLCGNKGTASSRVVVDTAGPIITITGVSDGLYNNLSVRPIVNISDANPGGTMITLDGNPYDGTLVDDEGDHSLSVQAIDLAGNTADSSVSFVIDRTPPVALLYGVQMNSYQSKTVLIDGGMSDANPGNISLRIDGYEVSTMLPYLWDTSYYMDGDHTLELSVVDKALNTGSTIIPVFVDNTKPTVKLLLPENGSLFASSLVELLWNGNDNFGISFYQLFLDDAPTGNTTDQYHTLDGLSDGSHQAIIKAYDMANNTGTGMVCFTIDTMPPIIQVTNLEDGEYYNHNVSPDVNVSDANLNFTSMMLNGMAYDDAPICDEGYYSLYLYAEDHAGNNASRTINFTIDKTPPSLSVQELTNNPIINFPWYNLTGNVDTDADLTVNGLVVPHDGHFNYTADVTVGINNYTVVATDQAGNNATWNKSRMVDMDLLPDYYELNVTHTDPLKGDSDEDGMPDDQEDPDKDGLINLAEYAFGTSPTNNDTDSDGLPDLFELEGTQTSPVLADTDNNTISDSCEDPDQDGLTNLQEYNAGTLPHASDIDMDGLNDGYEVNVSHSNPLSRDSDVDGLTDDSELKVGTLPNVPDSNGNGILDGNETFTTTASDESLGISVAVKGKGDLSKNVTFFREASEYYNISLLASPIVDVSLDDPFDSAMISMKYDPAIVGNPANLSLAYFNESLGLYVPVMSRVDIVNHTVSANVSHFCPWVILDANGLLALYKKISDFNHEAYYGKSPGIPKPGDNLTVPYDSSAILLFIESDSGGNDQYGLWSPSKKVLGYGHDTTPGTVFDLGTYTQNTELIFYLINDRNQTFLSGPGNRNPDGLAHAYIKPISNDTWNIGWEDIQGGGDRDYNDVILNVTFVRSTADTDGDGLPDYVETHGIMDNLGHYYYPDPYRNDTDQDGLKDNMEVGLLRTDANDYIKYSFNVTSDPTNTDSDYDDLTDSCEVQGSIIYVADSRDSAIKYKSHLYFDPYQSIDDILNGDIPGNAKSYCTPILAKSNPLLNDTDSDGIKDGIEIGMWTHPDNVDTDGDHINDSVELKNGGDPTVFDLIPPKTETNSLSVTWNYVSTDYRVLYTVSDDGGVSEVNLLKNNEIMDLQAYTDRRTSVQRPVAFTINPLEQTIDYMRTPTLTIGASDSNGNSVNRPIYKGSSSWALLATKVIGTDNIFSSYASIPLGIFAGFSSAVCEIPEMCIDFYNDPIGFIAGIQKIMDLQAYNVALYELDYSSPEKFFLSIGRAMLPVNGDYNPSHNLIVLIAIRGIDREETDNPYPAGSIYHYEFAGGWGLGYAAPMLITLLDSGGSSAGLKGARTGDDLVRAEEELTSGELKIASEIASNSGKIGAVEEAKLGLAKDIQALDIENGMKLLDEAATGTKAAEVPIALKEYQSLSTTTKAALDPYKLEAERFLMETGPEGKAFLESMDSGTLQKMFSLEIKDPLVGESDLQQIAKIKSDTINMRINLVTLNIAGVSPGDIGIIIKNIDTFKNTKGISRVVRDVSTADVGTFKGSYFQLEFAAADPGNVVEFSRPSGLGAGGRPGDIDVIKKNENGDLVGYECKNRMYGISEGDKTDLLSIQAGLEKLKQNGIINDYKILFRERPRDDVIAWMSSDSVKISWDYFMK